MKFGFLIDPIATLSMEKDTSIVLMAAAERLGHAVFGCCIDGLWMNGSTVMADGWWVQAIQSPTPSITIIRSETIPISDLDFFWIRKDPPFDANYLMATWLLDHAPSSVKFINSPAGIRTVNEKLWATQFESIVPPTLVTRKKAHFQRALNLWKTVVIKPLNGFGGAGVFRLTHDDLNRSVAFETLSCQETVDIIVQQYIPESTDGDKRILLFEGEPIGAALRIHSQSDHRNNVMAGGHVAPAEITHNDKKIIEILRPKLRELGLNFVGIDIIGPYLVEVNVTSPTVLKEIIALSQRPLDDIIIQTITNTLTV